MIPVQANKQTKTKHLINAGLIMIPWVREKFAERRAKWLSNRKSNRLLSAVHVDNEITATLPSTNPSSSSSSSPIVTSSTITANNISSSSRAIYNSINLNLDTLLRESDASQDAIVTNRLPDADAATSTAVAAISTRTARSILSSATSSLCNACNQLAARNSSINHRHYNHHSNHPDESEAITTAITTTTTAAAIITIVTTTVTPTAATSSSTLLSTTTTAAAAAAVEAATPITTTTTTTNKSLIKYQSRIKTGRRSAQDRSNTVSDGTTAGSKDGGKQMITVRVICPSIRIMSFETDTYKRLAELKNDVIVELTDDLASMPLFAPDVRALGPRFRLVKAEYEGGELPEQQTLAQLNIEDNELLVLVLKRNIVQQIVMQTRELRGASDLEIEHMTRGIRATSTNTIPMVDLNEIFQQSNLQFDVRKVLISLAKVSAMIIGVGPYAERLISMLKQKLVNKRNYHNDTLQCLVDMGFKKEKAEYALKLHNNVYSTALEWLIQKQNEDMTVEEAVMSLPKSSSLCSPSAIMTDNGPAENVKALCEIVRIYSHREIPPTPESVKQLMDMGFSEPDVIKALKKTCNNRAAACEWLCGLRSGSLVELRDGLSHDSTVLQSLLQLPHVQLSLSNPKVLLAFLAILENENSLRVWSGSDTSSVITHILQKYHEEKHVMGINQFYNDRQ